MQKQDEEKMPDVERENWDADDLVEEGSGESADETVRKVLRGNEEQGDADDRDVVGSVDRGETAYGREENKREVEKMVDDKLAQEEAQRAANYEAVKSNVEADVNSGDQARADQTTASEAQRMNNIADNMRGKAMNEIVDTDREVERGRVLARVSQVVDYIFFVIYGLLAIRLMLALFAARSSAGFVQFINSITDPLYAPFKGIVPSPSVEGGFTLALPIIIAIVVYLLIHLAINGLLRIFVHRKTEI